MDNLNPVQVSSQRLAKLAAGTLLYHCRVAKVQKPVLDILAALLCEVIESLLRSSVSFASGTPSLILYEGIEGQFVSMRPRSDFVHEAPLLLDLAASFLPVHPSPTTVLSGQSNSWNPNYALLELLEYARIQVRFAEGQRDNLKRLLDPSQGRSSECLQSIFENNGFVNLAYSIIPPATKPLEELAEDAMAPSKQSLERIQEEEQPSVDL